MATAFLRNGVRRGRRARTGTGPQEDCDPAYPDDCLPSPPPDLDCADVGHRVTVDQRAMATHTGWTPIATELGATASG